MVPQHMTEERGGDTKVREMWHVGRMKTNNKINKNKTKIESIESINRGRKEVE